MLRDQVKQVAQHDALISTKAPFKDAGLPKRIQQVQFDVLSSTQLEQAGAVHVYQRALYQMPERKPQKDGVLDQRLGISNKQATCETCGQKLADCVGHFGYIRLVLPVFHIGYFRNTIQILQCICKECSRVLLADEERYKLLKRLRRPSMERLARARAFKQLNEKCKRVKVCQYCGATNGTVKKATGNLKITHDIQKQDKGAYQHYLQTFQRAAELNDTMSVSNLVDVLDPQRVHTLFKAIPDEDCVLLDLPGRPEDLLMEVVPVPPVCIRPSVEMDSVGSNEDDITMKLMQITEANNVLRQVLERGVPMTSVRETWDFLQIQCALLINADLPGLSLPGGQQPARPSRGFVQRLKGKQGRFRGNLSGKRVDFSGRTVISPDPNVGIHEVCIPQRVATVMSYPERVTEHNIEKLKQCVINGPGQWPGANFVCFPNGTKWFLKYGDRRRAAQDLKVGDIVERHLENGDVVLFNRQPSLHRMSIMAHRARIMPWRTLRFNECVCNPYNADFDGDEMNLHVPQTEEARTEAALLMGVVHNLCTPKNGEILVAATQDFLTSAYLLTNKDVFYTRGEVGMMACYMGDALDQVDLPAPAILHPVELWTGKQVFSMIVRPNAQTQLFVTLETKEKQYKGNESMDIADGWVIFRNSELLCGRLGKATLGNGNKSGLYQVLATDFSNEAAALCMNRLAKFSARFIGNRGFSIGIADVTPTADFNKAKRKLLENGYKDCEEYLVQWMAKQLTPQPGSSMEQTLENMISGRLSRVRDEAGKLCMSSIQRNNSPLIMAQCGSKGSPINIAQMMALVGQQMVGGKRAPNGFQERSLPHFPRGDRTAEAKGYVANSFYSGLVPTEFLFHTMAGREGLVDTAVKTAETGYMSRRLMKALEDLYVHYDNTVRNASNGIVQLEYGGDGMDPVAMEGKEGQPVQFARLLTLIQSVLPRDRQGPDGTPLTRLPSAAELEEAVRLHLSDPDLHLPVVLEHAAKLPAGPERMPQGKGKLLYDGMTADKVRQTAQAQMEQRQWASLAFKTQLKAFLEQQVASVRAAEQQRNEQVASMQPQQAVEGMQEDAVEPAEPMDVDQPEGTPKEGSLQSQAQLPLAPLSMNGGITIKELDYFVKVCKMRYDAKRIDHGSTVGAVGAQSIGEPGTQMTLKTFHFAGVASMNVTLGVPRLKEIINASKNISTPIMEIMLEGGQRYNVDWAKRIKAQIERTCLRNVARIQTVYAAKKAFLEIRLLRGLIHQLHLDISAETVKQSILKHPRIKLDESNILCTDSWTLEVTCRKEGAMDLGIGLHLLRDQLGGVVVQGIPTVERVVVAEQEGKGAEQKPWYKLLAEGLNLQAVMGIKGVLGLQSETNHVMEIEKCLGIEAARNVIISQIKGTMGAHGMVIDDRHTMLLADCMTYKGEVLGITRNGIARMKDSVLMLASFEKTTDHLFDAALHGRVDEISGVSESIIMGIPMPVGTGLFKLRYNTDERQEPQRRPEPLLEEVFAAA